MKITLALLSISAVIALTPSPVAAQTPPQTDATARAHDGLFLQAQMGIARLAAGDGAGGGGVLNLAAGAAVSPHVIVFGAVFTNEMTYTRQDRLFGVYDVGVILAGGGAGLAYCFTPSNLCLSGVLGVAYVRFKFNHLPILTPTGFSSTESTFRAAAFKGAVTKEWWLSNQVALGVGGQLILTAPVPYAGDVNGVSRPRSLGFLASLTFN